MRETVYDIPVTRIDGQATTLGAFRGKVLVTVDVPSHCRLTSQYNGLEAVYRDKTAQGFEVLGFPANNVMNQESGTEAQIGEFCSSNYKIEFPLFGKICVAGGNTHPLYSVVTQAKPKGVGEGTLRERLSGYGINPSPPGEVVWNFEKVLVSRVGRVVERFAPDVVANDPRLLAAIHRVLAAQ